MIKKQSLQKENKENKKRPHPNDKFTPENLEKVWSAIKNDDANTFLKLHLLSCHVHFSKKKCPENVGLVAYTIICNATQVFEVMKKVCKVGLAECHSRGSDVINEIVNAKLNTQAIDEAVKRAIRWGATLDSIFSRNHLKAFEYIKSRGILEFYQSIHTVFNPLERAMRYQAKSILDFLLKSGMSFNDATHMEQNFLFNLCVYSSFLSFDIPMLQQACKLGLNLNSRCSSKFSSDVPLYCAIEKSAMTCAQLCPLIQFCFDHGFDPYLPGREGIPHAPKLIDYILGKYPSVSLTAIRALVNAGYSISKDPDFMRRFSKNKVLDYSTAFQNIIFELCSGKNALIQDSYGKLPYEYLRVPSRFRQNYEAQLPHATNHGLSAATDVQDVQRILAKHPESVNSMDSSGMTPLISAILRRDVESVKILLKYGAFPNQTKPHCNCSPITHASGHAEITKLLLQAHVDPPTENQILQMLLKNEIEMDTFIEHANTFSMELTEKAKQTALSHILKKTHDISEELGTMLDYFGYNKSSAELRLIYFWTENASAIPVLVNRGFDIHQTLHEQDRHSCPFLIYDSAKTYRIVKPIGRLAFSFKYKSSSHLEDAFVSALIEHGARLEKVDISILRWNKALILKFVPGVYISKTACSMYLSNNNIDLEILRHIYDHGAPLSVDILRTLSLDSCSSEVRDIVLSKFQDVKATHATWKSIVSIFLNNEYNDSPLVKIKPRKKVDPWVYFDPDPSTENYARWVEAMEEQKYEDEMQEMRERYGTPSEYDSDDSDDEEFDDENSENSVEFIMTRQADTTIVPVDEFELDKRDDIQYESSETKQKRILLQILCRFIPRYVELRDSNGNNFLHWAFTGKIWNSETFQIVKDTLKSSAIDVNEKNNSGATPIELVAWSFLRGCIFRYYWPRAHNRYLNRAIRCMRFLLENGANFEVRGGCLYKWLINCGGNFVYTVPDFFQTHCRKELALLVMAHLRGSVSYSHTEPLRVYKDSSIKIYAEEAKTCFKKYGKRKTSGVNKLGQLIATNVLRVQEEYWEPQTEAEFSVLQAYGYDFNKLDSQGSAFIHSALVMPEYWPLVPKLIPIVNLEIRDSEGATPLIKLAKYCMDDDIAVEFAGSLIEAGAVQDATDNQGYDALHYASMHRANSQLKEFLVQRNVKRRKIATE